MITQRQTLFFILTRYCTVKKVPSCLVLLRYFWMLKQLNSHLSIRKLVFVSRYKYSHFCNFLVLTLLQYRSALLAIMSKERQAKKKLDMPTSGVLGWISPSYFGLSAKPNAGVQTKPYFHNKVVANILLQTIRDRISFSFLHHTICHKFPVKNVIPL